MNRLTMAVRLTKDPEIKGNTVTLKVAYKKSSGKLCYITAVANGNVAKKIAKLKKGDTMYIDGRLSSFLSDRWKAFIEIEKAYTNKEDEV